MNQAPVANNRYRPEIDGLRAVAVVAVIFYHFRVPGFSGGYVGVDVFFVISGFLISKILIDDIVNSRYSLLEFYVRRARRILPALFLVCFVAFILSWLLLPPNQFLDFGQSLVSVGLFSSNILFWQESGYFELASEMKPLIHTWSLSVEEQFYLIFPFYLQMLLKVKAMLRLPIVFATAMLSLSFAQYGSTAFPVGNYFLLPGRVWQLLAGTLCALFLHAGGRFNFKGMTLIGLLGIFVAVYFYNEDTPFPGIYAILPVIGVVLVLLNVNNSDSVNLFLSNKLLVGIGLISYSLYLWHQIVLVFGNILFHGYNEFVRLSIFLVLTFSLSYISWIFVEIPARKASGMAIGGNSRVFIFSGLGLICMIFIGLLIHLTIISLPYSIPEKISQSMTRPKPSNNCFDVDGSHLKDHYLCEFGANQESATSKVLLMGDSHALSVKNVFAEIAEQTGTAGFYAGYSGCPPLLGIYVVRDDQHQRDCNALVTKMYADARALKVDTIVLVGRWSFYTGDKLGRRSASGSIQHTLANPSDSSTIENSRSAFNIGLVNSAEFASSHGISLYILSQVPEQPYDAESIYYAQMRDSNLSLSDLSVRSSSYENDRAIPDEIIGKVASQYSELQYLSIVNYVCNSESCPVGDQTKSYYFDRHHLTYFGAKRFSEIFLDILIE